MYDDEELTLEESENTYENDSQQLNSDKSSIHYYDSDEERYHRVKRVTNRGNNLIRRKMMSTPGNINNRNNTETRHPTQKTTNTNSSNSSDNSVLKVSNILSPFSESSELKGKGTIVKALKNPVTRKIILIAIPIFLLLMLILFIVAVISADDDNSGEYEYYTEGACQLVKYQDKLMDIEDYVAGVMATQIGEFSYSEATLKTASVMIRTYTISHGQKIGDNLDECYYDVSNIDLEYDPDIDYSSYNSVANSTKGLIVEIDGKIIEDSYDASFINSIEQTQKLDTTSEHTWEQIINYYYNEKAKIKTTDQSYRKSFVAEGTIFRQADSRWGSIPLGNSSINMANSGCAVTSIAIGISFSGTPLTVDEFDAGVFVRALNAGGCFTEGGGIKWSCSAIYKIAPSVRFVARIDNIGTTNEEKIAVINSYPLDKYIVITHFQNERAPRGHFVNFQEFLNSDEYLARDPSPGTLVAHSIAEMDRIVIYSY